MANGKKGGSKEAQVHQAISGIPYPATKEELLDYARAKSENGGVMDLLGKLPEMEYRNEPQVLSTLKEYTEIK